jgi:DNA-binding MarR family transcriptional regulator
MLALMVAGASASAEEVWALLTELTFELMHPEFDAAIGDFELAPTQALALKELARHSPMPMRDLARALRCDPSNVTGVTDRMEARGLVVRQPDPRDRRVKTLALTPAGRQLGRQLGVRLLSPPEAVGRLAETDQELLRDLLRKLLAARRA